MTADELLRKARLDILAGIEREDYTIADDAIATVIEACAEVAEREVTDIAGIKIRLQREIASAIRALAPKEK